MKYLHFVVLGCLSIAALLSAVAAKPEVSQHEAEMQKKLELSKDILGGLVTEDFDKIVRSGNALNELGKRKWQENDSLSYRTQNQVFWFTTGTLVMAAENKNIDGATLAYTQMTHSCVHCHKVIRGD